MTEKKATTKKTTAAKATTKTATKATAAKKTAVKKVAEVTINAESVGFRAGDVSGSCSSRESSHRG